MAAFRVTLPQESAYVQKTGLPFYDAARLWGAGRLLFGTLPSRVYDRGSFWELRGYGTPRMPIHTIWVRQRLAGRGLEKIEGTTLKILDRLEPGRDRGGQKWSEIKAYFSRPFAEARADTNVGRYLEPALLQGSRGPESWGYGQLASQGGRPFRVPFPEAAAATVGICLAGLGSSGTDQGQSRLLLLPVPSFTPGQVVGLGPFIHFDHEIRHRAGGIVGPVALGLHVLRQIADVVPIEDFAYTRHGPGRGFYTTGFLGLRSAVRAWDRGAGSPGMRRAVTDMADVLWRTRNTRDARLLSFARNVAAFAHAPSLKSLEAVLRSRARTEASTDNAFDVQTVQRLWTGGNRDVIEGVLKLAEITDIGPGDALARNVAAALNEAGDAWIGWYSRLEYAPTLERFLREIERLLTRAEFMGRKRAAGDGGRYRFQSWKRDDAWYFFKNRKDLEGRYFREYRTSFLLEVQRWRRVLKFMGTSEEGESNA